MGILCGDRGVVSRLVRGWKAVCVAAAAVMVSGGVARAQGPSQGADVMYSECTSTMNYGQVNGIRGYALGTNTCNIGNMSLQWVSHGTPALAMNMYRLSEGRLLQIGQGWCKTACCAGSGSGCGYPCAAGSFGLHPGCMDVYSAGFNGGQTALGPRSVMNAFTGVIGAFPGTSGDAIYRRLQVPQTEMSLTGHPGAIFFIEGEYCSTDDAAAHNSLNNASYKRVTINQTTYDLALQGAMSAGNPAIKAWRDHGLGVGVPDLSVVVTTVDVPGEGRFHVACKTTALGGGRWLYDYAVFNLNSDRSGGSLVVPLGANVVAANAGFHGVPYHSGEPYDNTNWTISTSGGSVTWASPQPFSANPNSNALRWGTMYNFWFEANAAPVSGSATLGLFKPGTPDSIALAVSVPGVACRADWDQDSTVTPLDVSGYVNSWIDSVAHGTLAADMDGNGSVQPADVSVFVNQWFAALGGSC